MMKKRISLSIIIVSVAFIILTYAAVSANKQSTEVSVTEANAINTVAGQEGTAVVAPVVEAQSETSSSVVTKTNQVEAPVSEAAEGIQTDETATADKQSTVNASTATNVVQLKAVTTAATEAVQSKAEAPAVKESVQTTTTTSAAAETAQPKADTSVKTEAIQPKQTAATNKPKAEADAAPQKESKPAPTETSKPKSFTFTSKDAVQPKVVTAPKIAPSASSSSSTPAVSEPATSTPSAPAVDEENCDIESEENC